MNLLLKSNEFIIKFIKIKFLSRLDINKLSFFLIIKKKFLKMSGFRCPVGTRYKCLSDYDILKAFKGIFLKTYSSLIFSSFWNFFRSSKSYENSESKGLLGNLFLKQIAEIRIPFLVR